MVLPRALFESTARARARGSLLAGRKHSRLAGDARR
jgi:hypothetical protein